MSANNGRRYIVIDDWRRFQHYKDRTPKWIKTYTELMHDDDYLGLSGHRRGVLHGIWMEYATSRCRVADDTRTLTRRLNLKVTRADLISLNHAGFIHFSASAPLAQPYENASLEKSREDKTPPTPPKGGRRSRDKTDEPPPPRVCPECGPIHLPQGATLADHRFAAHGHDDVPF